MELLASLNIILLVIVVASNLILAISVFRNNPKSATNVIFTILNVVVTLWVVIMYISLQGYSVELSLLWSRLTLFFATPMSALFFLFANTIPSDKIKISRWVMRVGFVLTVVVMLVTLSPYAFKSVQFQNGNPSPETGIGLVPFGVYTVSLSVLAVVVLLRRYLDSRGELRRQLFFVLVGIFLMLGLVTFTIFVPLVLFNESSLVVFFPLYTLLFTGLAAFAIVRHNLFSIKIFATEAITITLWVILFAKIFVAGNTSELVIDSTIFIATLAVGILLVRSVRREVKQRRQLQTLNQKLEEMDAQKDEFISVAAHELRAPMTAIRGYLSMILEGDAGQVPQKVREYLDNALIGNDRLVRLVTNMLNVSRIEEGRLTYNMGNVKLTEVIKTVFDEYCNEAKTKNLGCKLNIASNLVDKVYVDTDRIHEVVSNLISNAIKYTDQGEVIVNVLNRNGNIYVEVVDTGRGLSVEEQQKLFNKFYRAESNIGKQIGTGLGLYISKLLVQKFGGQIGVFSKRDRGSTFWFELPVVK